MKLSITPKQLGLMALIVLAGIVLAMLLMNQGKDEHREQTPHVDAEQLPQDEHAHEKSPPEFPRGPHGGRLLSQDGYAIEVTIFEQNVPPQFRLYTYKDGELLNPAESEIVLELQRLGRPMQRIQFVREGDYLKGDQVIEEPHSFTVHLKAEQDGKLYRFTFEQIEARVEMTDRQLELNAIEILTAGPATIKNELKLVGEIKLNADRAVTVVPRLAGMVESVLVNAGDTVQKGQVLAIISSQLLAGQRSELMAAQKRLHLARTTYEREKKLWEEKISAEQDYLAAKQAMQEAEIAVESARQQLQAIGIVGNSNGNLTRYEIRAPLDGLVAEKQIAVGQVAREDTPIFVIADLTTVWAEMTVYAQNLGTILPGQRVTVKATAFDASASGTVSYVSPLVGESSRTAVARIVLPNARGLWRPGLPVSGELVAEEIEVPLAVATEGLQSLRDWQVVFARYGQQFEARPLKLGRIDDRYAEVLDGLLPGERYAAKNSFLIKAELGKAGASHDH